jgi:hypothetical protein
MEVAKHYLILMLLTIAAVASGQVERSREWYLSTGGAVPTGDFNVRYNFGLNGAVGVGFRIAPQMRLVAKAEVQSFKLDQNAFLDAISGGNHVILMAGVDFRFFKDYPRWSFDPILLVGGGLAYSFESQLTVGPNTFDAQRETKPYINFGVGFNANISPTVSAFAMVRYVLVSHGFTKAEFFPITIGVRFPTH